MELKEKIYNYKTKYFEGFCYSDIDKLLSEYPLIDKDSFNNALKYITVLKINNETVIYHYDVLNALYCGLENRPLNELEWD